MRLACQLKTSHHMGRPRAILQSEFPYNVSARCINRDWFEVPLDHVWEILCSELHLTAIIYNLKIHCFVLMGNHFHLIVSTPDANISVAMKRFMEVTSKRIGKQSNRINRIWGARHYKTIIETYPYYMNAYKYIYFNPVRAGIVERCEDYKFSTLRGLLGQEKILVPLLEDNLLFNDPVSALDWLNRRPSDQRLRAIQAGLKKARFAHVKCPKSRKQIIGEDEVI